MALWPEQIRNLASKTSESPGKAFLTGFVIFIVTMIVSLILMITVIGIPLSIVIIVLTLLVLYTVRIISAIWLGKYIFSRVEKESKDWHDLLLGLFILLLVGELPIIGALIYMAATFIPLGNIYFASGK